MENLQETTVSQKNFIKPFGRGKELSTSQKQAVIKLIEKKDRHKRFIKGWRSISLYNVDVTLILKVFANRTKGELNQNIYYELSFPLNVAINLESNFSLVRAFINTFENTLFLIKLKPQNIVIDLRLKRKRNIQRNFSRN